MPLQVALIMQQDVCESYVVNPPTYGWMISVLIFCVRGALACISLLWWLLPS